MSLSYKDMPAEFYCNKYVIDGYRSPHKSLRWYLRSFFEWHNESVNAWTMAVGFFTFLYYILNAAKTRSTFLFAGAMLVMFATSTCFHIFWPSSARNYNLLLKLDHTMICVCTGIYVFPLAELALGSNFSPYWWLGTCVTLYHSKKIFTTHMPQENRILLCLKNCWYIPALLVHTVAIKRGVEFIARCVIVGFLYCVGATAYSSKYPEKKYPGKFDYFGSHEIMHACVVLAGTLHIRLFLS